MTKSILRTLLAAALLSPAIAFAMPNRNVDNAEQEPNPHVGIGELNTYKPLNQRTYGFQENTSTGTGMVWGNDPGHVASPSNAQIDPSTRGPLNDIHPGGVQAADPSAAARKPKPVY